MLLAASGVFATSPKAAASQVSAKVTRASRPIAASHSLGLAFGLKPRAIATPMTSTMLARVWMVLPTTCPVSTEVREIAIVRKRLMIPAVMSVQTATAVAIDPEVAAMRMMPGAR
jgi:hypothetical protein